VVREIPLPERGMIDFSEEFAGRVPGMHVIDAFDSSSFFSRTKASADRLPAWNGWEGMCLRRKTTGHDAFV